MKMRTDCVPCLSAATSGLARYPWTCVNGHTLYRGGGGVIDWENGGLWGVPMERYEPPKKEQN